VGTSGIGKATALAFAEAGAKVDLTGRREKEGADVAAEITKNGGTAAFVRADVAKDADVVKAIDFVVSTHNRLDDDQQVCHVYERYRDSAAVMTHLGSFGANFAVRLREAVTPARPVVDGTPSAQVKDGLAGLGPVYMAPLGALDDNEFGSARLLKSTAKLRFGDNR
jgi:NAD(P)-dependent dehydrogenase (short-subunit alcohol dehydrogenase family)